MPKKSRKSAKLLFARFFPCLGLLFLQLPAGLAQNVVITHNALKLEINGNMESRVNAIYPGAQPLMTGFAAGEVLVTKYFTTGSFRLSSTDSNRVDDASGRGMQYNLHGLDEEHGLAKTLSIRCYDFFPSTAYFRVTYFNTGKRALEIRQWINQQYAVSPSTDTPHFWSFQGSSHSDRRDWIQKVNPGFSENNFMGMNAADYGGGIPVTDLWRPDAGLAVGYAGAVSQPVSLPVDYDRYGSMATIGVRYTMPDPALLAPGDSLVTLQTFTGVHQRDCFATLRIYGAFMETLGVKAATTEPQAFEPVWCAWGYERDFKLKEILNTLPKVKALGIKWVGLDDGFQQAEGDWQTNPEHFPGGDAQMKAFVDSIHAQGMKAVLWWAPLAADPGSKFLKNHPNSLIQQKNGAPQFITWWNAYYMAPTDTAVQEHLKETVTMFMKDWGFDALKLDGQHMNACAPDYADGHGLNNPEESVQKMPLAFKTIYETARSIKPDAVVEFCPCGDCIDIYHMPYTNQFVASDPLNSHQVRLKGKMLKALMPSTAYFGDHVELTDNGRDFASQLGVGAVPGTKFVWPATGVASKDANLLTPEKEILFRKALQSYNTYHLSTGNYRGDLYDLGYDYPETHCIEKNGKIYYAFFAAHFSGTLALRGLTAGKTYFLRDYFNNKPLGKTTGVTPSLSTSFDGFLLLEASGK